MRTTITLDPDVDAMVRRLMRDREVSFKQAVNLALRAGLTPVVSHERFETPTFDMGGARVSLDRALQLAGSLEDEELLRQRSMGTS